MAKKSLDSLLQCLRRVALTGDDAHLLERFARQGDESAFARLVLLHGPMVFGLCQRVLRHEQDAEDVFQATFLTLARKAGTIGKKESLACWLYKVAYRVACRSRSRELTNRAALLSRVAVKDEGHAWRGVLDEEIAGLAERYRQPIVLCYLQGKTIAEAARLLHCPAGTVASRLARAREQLRRRLTRRGWALPAGALTTVPIGKALAVPLPAGLVTSTLACVSGKSANTGALAAKVFALSDGVLRMMWLNKMKMAAGAVLAVILAATGVGLVVRQTWAEGGEAKQGAKQAVLQAQKSAPKAEAQEGTRPAVESLRKEVASLREEIKRLRDELRQSTSSVEKGAMFRGKPLAFWLAQSKDADASFRAQAIEALGYFAKKDKELIPLIVKALDEEDADRSAPGVDVLDTIAPGKDVASVARRALLLSGQDFVPALAEVVKDKSSPRARRDAVNFLMMLGPKAKAAVPALVQALQDDQGLRDAAVLALARIGPGAKPAITALVQQLGPAIAAFKSEWEKYPLWNDAPEDYRAQLASVVPNRIFHALAAIDPQVKSRLPTRIALNPWNAPSFDALVSEWQKADETLRREYAEK
jgi:RNA polymerase sigma factor (sigma-70 family)